MYNKGDIKGCADLYMKTAESVLPAASGAEKQRLKDGLQTARSSSSSKDAAWALRNAFDDILEGLGGGHEVLRGNDNAVVHQRIRNAISLGVPLYNAGDHGACADVYTVCVREIESSLDQAASEAARSLLRQLPSFSNDDKRAWALRDLMDAILAGSLVSANKTMMLDFRQASQIQAWKSVNDGVMGGMSTGGMSLGSELGEACGVFSGVLSTQNNGGFASVRGAHFTCFTGTEVQILTQKYICFRCRAQCRLRPLWIPRSGHLLSRRRPAVQADCQDRLPVGLAYVPGRFLGRGRNGGVADKGSSVVKVQALVEGPRDRLCSATLRQRHCRTGPDDQLSYGRC
jgi:hypothetical protein